MSSDDGTVGGVDAADRVAALGALALHLAGARTVEALTGTVVADGLGLLGVRGGALGLLDGPVLRFTATGFGHPLQGRLDDVPLDAARPAAQAVRTGHAVFLGDRESALTAFPALAGVDAVGDVHAWACVPLRAGERVLGVLAAWWSEPRRFPGPAWRRMR